MIIERELKKCKLDKIIWRAENDIVYLQTFNYWAIINIAEFCSITTPKIQ